MMTMRLQIGLLYFTMLLCGIFLGQRSRLTARKCRNSAGTKPNLIGPAGPGAFKSSDAGCGIIRIIRPDTLLAMAMHSPPSRTMCIRRPAARWTIPARWLLYSKQLGNYINIESTLYRKRKMQIEEAEYAVRQVKLVLLRIPQ